MDWHTILKRASKFERAIAEEYAGEDMERDSMRRKIAYQRAYREAGYVVPSEKLIREEMDRVTDSDIDAHIARRKNK